MSVNSFKTLVSAEDSNRFEGIKRNYTPEQVNKLRGSLPVQYTLAEYAANKLWSLIKNEPYVNALGAMTGGQSVQMVRAGLKAIYLSGWQVAADANGSGQTYPDQSLYPADGGPALAKRINNALTRADQIQHLEKSNNEQQEDIDWFAPIVADAEAGFGGSLNAFEIAKAYIEAGVGGIHFEDQLAAEKKCGHLGGKVLIPVSQHIRNLNAARLAADVMGTSTVIICRTDADSAQLLTSDIDERDHPFISGERTAEGYFRLRNDEGMARCIARGLACAPYSDLIWMETSRPNIEQARTFAEAIHKVFPNKSLAYNCSPSFNWQANLDSETIERFQSELGMMGYKFQFVTLAGFHSLNHGMFDLARGYSQRGMAAYSQLQDAEFASEKDGYTATRHQREAGTGYFDAINIAVSGGETSTTAMGASTEAEQFTEDEKTAEEAAE
ncbi:MAG: isocitrate lyase [Alphaproteobacteria bacterium]|nr:isocitrate lyase [Alphaproteobacteria bacterium]|tara:strand:- start:111 stop:1436 length:1326 start_codon:yes stop_codon:yes gene_type:complete